MSIHLEIFFCSLTLILGSCVVYYTVQLSRKTSYAFLKPIVIFILLYNMSIFMRLILQYIWANILASHFSFDVAIYYKLLAPFALAINIGMTVSLGAVVLTLLGKRLSPKGRPWIVAIVALIILGYTTWIFPGPQFGLHPWLPLYMQYIHLAVVFVAYVFLVFLLIAVRGERDPDRASMVRSFAIFYLIAYTSLILSFVIHPDLHHFFVALVYFLFNLFLIFWLQNFFLPFYRHSVSAIADKGDLERFYEGHSISEREKEIVELILIGKSNKDIEHQLFISPHTVKNHIYRLYQKAGVNSRSQLIHLILGSKNCHD